MLLKVNGVVTCWDWGSVFMTSEQIDVFDVDVVVERDALIGCRRVRTLRTKRLGPLNFDPWHITLPHTSQQLLFFFFFFFFFFFLSVGDYLNTLSLTELRIQQRLESDLDIRHNGREGMQMSGESYDGPMGESGGWSLARDTSVLRDARQQTDRQC